MGSWENDDDSETDDDDDSDRGRPFYKAKATSTVLSLKARLFGASRKLEGYRKSSTGHLPTEHEGMGKLFKQRHFVICERIEDVCSLDAAEVLSSSYF